MKKVTLTIDFEVSEELVELYALSTHCTFVGEKDGPYNLDKAREMMNKYASTKKYGNNERLGIMKIYYGGKLVGFSMPRVIEEREHKVFKLETEELYYRIGTVFINPEYRGMGIMKETIREFRKLYPNLIWTCNELNVGSHRSALSGGLNFSHKVYVKERHLWDFEPIEGQVRVDNVYIAKSSLKMERNKPRGKFKVFKRDGNEDIRISEYLSSMLSLEQQYAFEPEYNEQFIMVNSIMGRFSWAIRGEVISSSGEIKIARTMPRKVRHLVLHAISLADSVEQANEMAERFSSYFDNVEL